MKCPPDRTVILGPAAFVETDMGAEIEFAAGLEQIAVDFPLGNILRAILTQFPADVGDRGNLAVGGIVPEQVDMGVTVVEQMA